MAGWIYYVYVVMNDPAAEVEEICCILLLQTDYCTDIYAGVGLNYFPTSLSDYWSTKSTRLPYKLLAQ